MGILSRLFRGKSDRERDLLIEHASLTQVGLLPNNLPRISGYQVHVHSQSAKDLSGDYYDFLLDRERKRMEAIIMDVSGKDFPASITASQLAGAMYILFKDVDMPLENKLMELNSLIFDRTRRETFVTVMWMRLDYENHMLSFANAGHNPLIVVDDEAHELMGKKAPAIGFVDSEKFNSLVGTTEVFLEKGSVAVAYTDGIVEAMNPSRKEYGTERLKKLISQYQERDLGMMTRALGDDVRRHESGKPPHDDQTVIAIKRMSGD